MHASPSTCPEADLDMVSADVPLQMQPAFEPQPSTSATPVEPGFVSPDTLTSDSSPSSVITRPQKRRRNEHEWDFVLRLEHTSSKSRLIRIANIRRHFRKGYCRQFCLNQTCLILSLFAVVWLADRCASCHDSIYYTHSMSITQSGLLVLFAGSILLVI